MHRLIKLRFKQCIHISSNTCLNPTHLSTGERITDGYVRKITVALSKDISSTVIFHPLEIPFATLTEFFPFAQISFKFIRDSI